MTKIIDNALDKLYSNKKEDITLTHEERDEFMSFHDFCFDRMRQFELIEKIIESDLMLDEIDKVEKFIDDMRMEKK